VPRFAQCLTDWRGLDKLRSGANDRDNFHPACSA
jgi:hypothetical protein